MKRSSRAYLGSATLVLPLLVSCAAFRDADSHATAASARPPTESRSLLAKLPKLDELPLANLLPGPRVKIAQVREKDLQELPSGRERAIAFENERKSRFWAFGGPVRFKEPNLPEAGAEMDGSLLPPRIW